MSLGIIIGMLPIKIYAYQYNKSEWKMNYVGMIRCSKESYEGLWMITFVT